MKMRKEINISKFNLEMLKGSFSCFQKLQSKIEPFLFVARSNFPVNRPSDLGHWNAVELASTVLGARSPADAPGVGQSPGARQGPRPANVLDTQSPVL